MTARADSLIHSRLSEEEEPPRRAWISPQGEMHGLDEMGLETHTKWINNPENRSKIPWQGDSLSTEKKMMADGWVRKHEPNDYEVGTDAAHKIATDHINKHYGFLPKFHNIQRSRW